ncbi:related to carbonic anhydrase [Phialocephala subalpina]|uniref:Carbonic anhydrase n=1 Tax=Phialocephala subalpina TaxID=576137 RepID=A0A1L7XW34_9HELO|nr:related to carbonic anhydrase [Phialocephala subalpina]
MVFIISVAGELGAANQKYASTFTKGDLALPSARKVAILACMDARLDLAKALGLEEGDAHVIRNAGGKATDAIRSLVISQQLLGTREIVIVHHSDCGMLTFSDDGIRKNIREELHENADHVAFLPFQDLQQSVLDNIKVLEDNQLLLDVPVTGYVYDVRTGKIERVSANTTAEGGKDQFLTNGTTNGV